MELIVAKKARNPGVAVLDHLNMIACEKLNDYVKQVLVQLSDIVRQIVPLRRSNSDAVRSHSGKGNGGQTKGQASHLIGNEPTRVHEVEIDGQPMGICPQPACFVDEHIAILGINCQILFIDNVAHLTWQNKQ